eukprot:254138-Alexandrium_andersonii.AAC.1
MGDLLQACSGPPQPEPQLAGALSNGAPGELRSALDCSGVSGEHGVVRWIWESSGEIWTVAASS